MKISRPILIQGDELNSKMRNLKKTKEKSLTLLMIGPESLLKMYLYWHQICLIQFIFSKFGTQAMENRFQ